MNFFSNKFLTVAMMAATTSSVFTACSKDDDDYYSRYDGKFMVTADVPSVVTMPYVTINNQLDMSVMDDRVESVTYDVCAEDTLNKTSFSSFILPLEDSTGKFSFTFEGLRNHTVMKYNAYAFIYLKYGDPRSVRHSSKDAYFTVDIDEEALVVTGDASEITVKSVYESGEPTEYDVDLSCQINMPAEHLDKYTAYIYFSPSTDDSNSGSYRKVTLDSNGHGTIHEEMYTPGQKFYYQAQLMYNSSENITYKGVWKSFTVPSE